MPTRRGGHLPNVVIRGRNLDATESLRELRCIEGRGVFVRVGSWNNPERTDAPPNRHRGRGRLVRILRVVRVPVSAIVHVAYVLVFLDRSRDGDCSRAL